LTNLDGECYVSNIASGIVTGRRLKQLRVNRGLSPEQLGSRVGVSGRTIRRVEEGGRPTVRTMFLLAKEFDCEVVDLWPL
jgi:transcriptional regulator with XRE-family HTH domain